MLKNYLVLLKFDTPTQALRDVASHINTVSTIPPAVVWTSKDTLGIAVVTEKNGRAILESCAKQLDKSHISNLLIIEIGKDYLTHGETTLDGWLHSHVRHPQTGGASEDGSKK